MRDIHAHQASQACQKHLSTYTLPAILLTKMVHAVTAMLLVSMNIFDR